MLKDKLIKIKNNKILMIVLFIVVIVISRFVGESLGRKAGEERAKAELQQSNSNDMKKMIDDAVEKSKTDSSAVEDMRKKSKQISENAVNSQSDEAGKVAVMAATLLGLYQGNMILRYDYCEKLGVKLDKFNQDFATRNRAVYDAIVKIQAMELAKGTKINFNQGFVENRDSFDKATKLGMEAQAKNWNVDAKTACLNFNAQSKVISNELALDKMKPEYSKAVVDYAKNL